MWLIHTNSMKVVTEKFWKLRTSIKMCVLCYVAIPYTTSMLYDFLPELHVLSEVTSLPILKLDRMCIWSSSSWDVHIVINDISFHWNKVFKGAWSDCFRFFSDFLRFWYQKKAHIFFIAPCEFYGWKILCGRYEWKYD